MEGRTAINIFPPRRKLSAIIAGKKWDCRRDSPDKSRSKSEKCAKTSWWGERKIVAPPAKTNDTSVGGVGQKAATPAVPNKSILNSSKRTAGARTRKRRIIQIPGAAISAARIPLAREEIFSERAALPPVEGRWMREEHYALRVRAERRRRRIRVDHPFTRSFDLGVYRSERNGAVTRARPRAAKYADIGFTGPPTSCGSCAAARILLKQSLSISCLSGGPCRASFLRPSPRFIMVITMEGLSVFMGMEAIRRGWRSHLERARWEVWNGEVGRR